MPRLFRLGAVFTTELCSVGLSDITAAKKPGGGGDGSGIPAAAKRWQMVYLVTKKNKCCSSYVMLH